MSLGFDSLASTKRTPYFGAITGALATASAERFVWMECATAIPERWRQFAAWRGTSDSTSA